MARENSGSVFSPLPVRLLISFCLTFTSPAVYSQPDFSAFTKDPASIYGKEARYLVYRNNKEIGTHTVRFQRKAENLFVKVKSDLAVRYLGIPVYRYSYEADEVWEDGKFVSVESRIKENLKKRRIIKARVDGKVLEVTDQGKTRSAPLVRFPSNHWHPDVLRESRLFHTVHARVHHVKIRQVSNDKIQLQRVDSNGQKTTEVVRARRFAYTGGFLAEVWYDTRFRWIQLRFNADDGSEIEYRCITCTN